jgi:hypothetical protein
MSSSKAMSRTSCSFTSSSPIREKLRSNAAVEVEEVL